MEERHVQNVDIQNIWDEEQIGDESITLDRM